MDPAATVARARTYSWLNLAIKVRLLKKKLGRKHLQLQLYGCYNFIKTNSSAALTFFFLLKKDKVRPLFYIELGQFLGRKFHRLALLQQVCEEVQAPVSLFLCWEKREWGTGQVVSSCLQFNFPKIRFKL